MKRITSILLLSMLGFSTKAQTVNFYGQSIETSNVCSDLGFANNDEAKKCLDKICEVAGIQNNYIIVPCDHIDNCQADVKDGDAYILYNNRFLERLKPLAFTVKSMNNFKYDWPTIAIFAHELGHLVNNHFSKVVRKRYSLLELETQADTYAGEILYKLGASLAQAQEVMRGSSVSEQGDFTHPSRQQRLTAIAAGWNKAKGDVKAMEKELIEPNSITMLDETDYTMQRGTMYPLMVKLDGGLFSMGDARSETGSDEKPEHSVNVNNFYIGKYEVTFAQYDAFCNATGRNKPKDIGFGRGKQPVVNVSWNDAINYCNWLSKQTGYFYRLPTEAEWEYAAKCRGNNTYSGGNDLDLLGWYAGNCDNQTHFVGTKQGNLYGLFDMTGNVWEWCSDWYGSSYYSISPINNPKGPDSGEFRVLRGGSWGDNEASLFCHVAFRAQNTPDHRDKYDGFRIVCTK